MSITAVMAAQDQGDAAHETRKRKIDHVLGLLDQPRPTTPARSNHSSISTSISSDSLRSPTWKSATISATYAPWDAEQCRARLLTLRSWPEHGRTSPINALAVARHGWYMTESSTIGKNLPGSRDSPRHSTMPARTTAAKTVHCTTCKRTFTCDLSTNVPGAREALASKYAEMMQTTRHAPSCPWRKRPCAPDVLKVRGIGSRTACLAEIEARQASLDGLELPEVVLGEEPTVVHLASAAALAICGWRAEQTGKVKLLTCDSCHRRIVLQSHSPIDAVAQHQAYCPWVDAATQGDAQPAWRLCMAHMLPQVDVHSDGVPLAQASPPSESISIERRTYNICRKLGFF